MQNIKNLLNFILAWCIVLTAFFPVGLFLLIYGAITQLWGAMGFGIGLVVIAFYGVPLIWVKYGQTIQYKRIVSAIVVEKIFSLEQIAQHLNLPVKVVLDRVDVCIQREYLVGYLRQGDQINPNLKINAVMKGYKCNSCGANFEVAYTAQPKCPYCGTIIND